MDITYEAAARLFDEGDFLTLIGAYPRAATDRLRLEPHHRALLAHALGLAGELEDARSLARHEDVNMSPAARSDTETALALVAWREGAMKDSLRHFRAALRLAQECSNEDRIAWAELRVFRMLIDTEPADNLAAMVRTVRQSVLRAGNPRATAYLHLCVAALAGQTGRADEARRHCDITDSLLRNHPNWWVLGNLCLSRASVAVLGGQPTEALDHLAAMKRAVARSGHAVGIAACEGMLGYLQFATGDLDRSERTILKAIDACRASAPRLLVSALDNLARVYLGRGDLDQCERTLHRLEVRLSQDVTSYHLRYAALTLGRVLIRRGQLRESFEWLTRLSARTASMGDTPFNCVLNLVLAQTHSLLGNGPNAAACLWASLNAGMAESRQLQAEYYSTIAEVLGDASPITAARARQRGLRLAHSPTAPTATSLKDASPPAALQAVVDSIAALHGLAYHPLAFGEELVAILKLLDESWSPRITKSSQNEEPPDTTSLALGGKGRNAARLVCDLPVDPAGALTLSNVIRIARAALELEHLRTQERQRAAIWPDAPVEEQAGAVFISEETRVLLEIARRIASTTVPVLITGETGTGKEVLARVIHAYSSRAHATFLPFNCSSTPKDMLDSQLFGHRRGAFTGAVDSFPGVIRSAAGGTLFLDEIGETTLDVQPKLLRFLESNEVHPIGEVQPARVDVRVSPPPTPTSTRSSRRGASARTSSTA